MSKLREEVRPIVADKG